MKTWRILGTILVLCGPAIGMLGVVAALARMTAFGELALTIARHSWVFAVFAFPAGVIIHGIIAARTGIYRRNVWRLILASSILFCISIIPFGLLLGGTTIALLFTLETFNKMSISEPSPPPHGLPVASLPSGEACTADGKMMNKARIIIVLIGMLLPYAARLPRGLAWLNQYIGVGVGGFLDLLGAFLFMGAFNAIAWGAIVGISFLYKRPECLIAPALPGFGFLAWAHYSLDLAADAQAAIALAFIPIYALLPIAFGGVIGYVADGCLCRLTNRCSRRLQPLRSPEKGRRR